MNPRQARVWLRRWQGSADQQRQWLTVLVSEYQLRPNCHRERFLSDQHAELHYVHGDPPQLAFVGPWVQPDGLQTSKAFALVRLPR